MNVVPAYTLLASAILILIASLTIVTNQVAADPALIMSYHKWRETHAVCQKRRWSLYERNTVIYSKLPRPTRKQGNLYASIPIELLIADFASPKIAYSRPREIPKDMLAQPVQSCVDICQWAVANIDSPPPLLSGDEMVRQWGTCTT